MCNGITHCIPNKKHDGFSSLVRKECNVGIIIRKYNFNELFAIFASLLWR